MRGERGGCARGNGYDCLLGSQTDAAAREELDGEEFTSLVAHVESCPACQERHRALTSDGPLVPKGGSWDDDRESLSTDAWIIPTRPPIEWPIETACTPHQGVGDLAERDDLARGFPEWTGSASS